jgi:hypothetical protein
MTRERLTFEATTPGGTVRGHTSGQTAKELVALVEAGRRGVTALECDTWAYRLAAYCHFLRRDWGLVIRTDREGHPGGWHGRHVLETPVRLITNDTGESEHGLTVAALHHTRETREGDH